MVSYACMSVTHVCTKETRRGQWVPWDWNHKHPWVSSVVLGTETLASGRAVSTLKCWVIYLSSPLSLNLEFDGKEFGKDQPVSASSSVLKITNTSLCAQLFTNGLVTNFLQSQVLMFMWKTLSTKPLPKTHLKYIIAKFDKNPKGSLRIWESMRIKF